MEYGVLPKLSSLLNDLIMKWLTYKYAEQYFIVQLWSAWVSRLSGTAGFLLQSAMGLISQPACEQAYTRTARVEDTTMIAISLSF